MSHGKFEAAFGNCAVAVVCRLAGAERLCGRSGYATAGHCHTRWTDDPQAAFELIWRFVALANGVYERCDDSTGRVQSVFHTACEDLIDLAEAVEPDPIELADLLLTALPDDDYGHYPALISGLAPMLGTEGLQHLGAGIAALDEDVSENYALRMALEEIADAEGDTDAYIAQQSDLARKSFRGAAEIAQRLLASGRLEEAWAAINAPDEDDRGWIPYEWEATRISVMQAMGQTDAARAFMWTCFARSFNRTTCAHGSLGCQILRTSTAETSP